MSSTSKICGVPTWHQQTCEKRSMKRHGRQVADVYPQEPKQEEDNLGPDKLKKGYQVHTPSYEHDSMVVRHKDRLEKIDDTLFKLSKFLINVQNKKNDQNSNLDKEKRKNKENTQVSQQIGNMRMKERALWFTDLARGKALAQLAKKPPLFKKKEEALSYLLDYRIPSQRALWYLKLCGSIHQSVNPSKTRKSTGDSSALEYTNMFYNELKSVMGLIAGLDEIDGQHEFKLRWGYHTFLSKQCFEEGVLDRQEFLNTLCTLFNELFVKRENGYVDTWVQLRIYCLFLAQFVDQICQNYLLARRAAFVLAEKLALMRNEYVDPNGGKPTAVEAYQEMVKCGHKALPIHTLSVMLQAICLDCPAALIWNNYSVHPDRTPLILQQLCGSALDLLPCAIYELPVPTVPEHEKFVEMVKMRNIEIVRRSLAVDHHWALNQRDQVEYSRLVDTCLNVIGILDYIDLLEKDSIDRLCAALFKVKRTSCYDLELIIRIKLMLQWAVTVQREGTFRGTTIAKIFARQIELKQSRLFAGRDIHDIVLEFLQKEGPQPNTPNFRVQFSALIILMAELVRLKVFCHDRFVKYLIKTGEMDYNTPVLLKFRRSHNGHYSQHFEDLTPDEPPPSNNLITFQPDPTDEHLLLEERYMTMNERILIQLPLRQVEEHRSECNQREIILYGINEERDMHREELKKLSREIIKMCLKKVYVQLSSKSDCVLYTRRLFAPKVQELLKNFRAQTYYDQWAICGWVSEAFSDQIRNVAYHGNLQIPTQEGLEIILAFYEECNYIYGIFEFTDALLPDLVALEKTVKSLRSDIIPGCMSGQLAYALCSYLSKHWQYFVHSDLAVNITNGMYVLTERAIRSQDFPMTGWVRSVAAFAYHARKQLKESNLADVKLLGKTAEFTHIFFHGNSMSNNNLRYNSLFFRDVFDEKEFPLRFPSFHEYKKRLPSFDLSHNRYSFVVNAILAVSRCGRDYDRLNDLANFCSHITAQMPILADEWVGAAKALCNSAAVQHVGFSELFLHIDISNTAVHYPLACFYMLLASKYCYSVPKLVAELLNNVFPSVMKKEHSKVDQIAEPGVCLALYLLAMIMCQTDEPFLISDHYVGTQPILKTVWKTAEENFLCMIHWNEMDKVLFPMLANICILLDTHRARIKHEKDLQLPRIVDRTYYRPEYLTIMTKAVQYVICEQDWVTLKMYRTVESNKMEAFNSERLKQNCLGQQLLRLGTRRRCEREILQELSVCNGNSKKALLDKLLSAMNLWNLRATLFDLMLMVKEISPEGVPKHAQQGAIAADALVGEIGRCCRDLFTNRHRAGENLPVGKIGKDFRFDNICNYWLISALVRLCPKPTNVPTSFTTTTVPGKILKEAATMLDTANDNTKERIQQSAWLLSQQPFLQLVITCLKCEGLNSRDVIVNALYKQMHDIILKVKENPSLISREAFAAEREGLLLRLMLVGRIFKEVCSGAHADSWCLLFFQILLYGVVNPERDRLLFETTFDMIANLLVWALTDPSTCLLQPQPIAPENEPKYRWPVYTSMIKKLKKEIGDRKVTTSLRPLLQLLSFPKSNVECVVCEPFGAQPLPQQKLSKTSTPVQNVVVGPIIRYGRYIVQPGTLLQASEKQKLSTYDFIAHYQQDINSKRGWNWSWFMTSKLDKLPIPSQRFPTKMVNHKHCLEYHRPNYVYDEAVASSDHFLCAPQIEATGETAAAAPTPCVEKEKEKEVKEVRVKNEVAATTQVSTESKPENDENAEVKPVVGPSPRTGRGGGRKRTNQAQGRQPGPRAKKEKVTAAAAAPQTTTQSQPFFSQNSSWPANQTGGQYTQAAGATAQTTHTAAPTDSDSKTKIHNMITKRMEEKEKHQNAQANASAATSLTVNTWSVSNPSDRRTPNISPRVEAGSTSTVQTNNKGAQSSGNIPVSSSADVPTSFTQTTTAVNTASPAEDKSTERPSSTLTSSHPGKSIQKSSSESVLRDFLNPMSATALFAMVEEHRTELGKPSDKAFDLSFSPTMGRGGNPLTLDSNDFLDAQDPKQVRGNPVPPGIGTAIGAMSSSAASSSFMMANTNAFPNQRPRTTAEDTSMERPMSISTASNIVYNMGSTGINSGNISTGLGSGMIVSMGSGMGQMFEITRTAKGDRCQTPVHGNPVATNRQTPGRSQTPSLTARNVMRRRPSTLQMGIEMPPDRIRTPLSRTNSGSFGGLFQRNLQLEMEMGMPGQLVSPSSLLPGGQQMQYTGSQQRFQPPAFAQSQPQGYGMGGPMGVAAQRPQVSQFPGQQQPGNRMAYGQPQQQPGMPGALPGMQPAMQTNMMQPSYGNMHYNQQGY